MSKASEKLVLDLIEVGADDVARVGGKGANLGELFCSLTKRGVKAVDGFATTDTVYRRLLETNGPGERLRELMQGLDYDDLDALNRAGREARALMLDTPLPAEAHEAILDAYRRLRARPASSKSIIRSAPDSSSLWILSGPRTERRVSFSWCRRGPRQFIL